MSRAAPDLWPAWILPGGDSKVMPAHGTWWAQAEPQPGCLPVAEGLAHVAVLQHHLLGSWAEGMSCFAPLQDPLLMGRGDSWGWEEKLHSFPFRLVTLLLLCSCPTLSCLFFLPALPASSDFLPQQAEASPAVTQGEAQRV